MPSLAYESGVSYRDLNWWKKDVTRETRHTKLVAALNAIRKIQIWRKESDLRHMRLYGNAPLLGFGLANYARPATLTGSKVGLNVVKNCSDAFVAKITKEKPKVSFVTSGGDWDLQNRARELEKFVEGQFYELGLYELMPQVVLDACIFGTGFVKFYMHGEGTATRIRAERVFPWEIVIDDQEGLYGCPRNFYQRKWIDRAVLMGLYGTDSRLKKAISEAKRDTDDVDGLGYNSTADQVLVTEAWHMPSKPGMSLEETDGMHALAIENVLLSEEPYAEERPPFVVYQRQKPPLGFWGIGLAEELTGLQLELNILMQKVQRGFHLMANGHWLVENASKVNTQKITNDWDIIRYSGTEPKVIAPSPIPEQVFTHIDRIYTRCYEITGISQLEAQSQKPKGLNSGKAIDAFLDVTTERFNISQRLYHQAFIEMAKMVLGLSRKIAHGDDGEGGGPNPEFDVMAPDKNMAHHINFRKNELEDDEYLMKLFPTNSLAEDPAERMSQVEKMAQAGWIDVQDAKRLLDFPDLERAADLENASYNAVEMCISKAIKDGVYKGPQPFLNLTQGMRQVQMALIKGWVDGVPESRLKLLRNWLTDAQELMRRAMTPPAPAMPANLPVLPGTPGGPPVPQPAPMPIPAPPQANGAPPAQAPLS